MKKNNCICSGCGNEHETAEQPEGREENHAKEQARMQLEGIMEMVQHLEHCNECKGTCNAECECHSDRAEASECYHDQEKAQEIIREDALEVATGKDFNGTRTYMILLCTGGPAVRITGELNEYDVPENATLEYQDWGTPWTEYHTTQAEEDSLVTYARCYYFEQ